MLPEPNRIRFVRWVVLTLDGYKSFPRRRPAVFSARVARDTQGKAQLYKETTIRRFYNGFCSYRTRKRQIRI